MSVNVKVKRLSRVYFPGEKVEGVVVVQSKGSLSHNGIKLVAFGRVKLLNSGKDQSVLESVQSVTDPKGLFSVSIDVAPEGKLPNGTTELPFEFLLNSSDPSSKLYETYHGVYVNVQYMIEVEITRGFLARDMQAKTEFLVQVPPEAAKRKAKAAQPVPFDIVPESLENLKHTASAAKVPKFKIVGHLDSAICDITRPLSGEVKIERCDAPIRSVEIQLVRVETVGQDAAFTKEATEVQNIQIADGDPPRGIPISIHMIFPRLFTCPSLATKAFKVEFAVNLVIMLEDGHLISENFPLQLVRRESSFMY